MKTLRFKVGDLARVVYAPTYPERVGEIVKILEVGPYAIGDSVHSGSGVAGNTSDYVVETARGVGLAKDICLEPLLPDADYLPPAVRSIFNVTPNQGLPVGPRPRVKA